MAVAVRVCAALLAASVAIASAEILQGVRPFDTLGDIKKMYPNATMKPVKAAWVTEDKGFYRLSGEGFPGELYVAFSDTRPFARSTAARVRKEAAEATPATEPDTRVLDRIAQQSDDDALTVEWVRWVPASPIPFERYKSKYGEPAKCDFSADTMQPYCSWPSRELLVALTDDRKMVTNAEAQFTKAEQRAAYLARFGTVPDWLKEPAENKTKQERKSAPQPR